MDGQGQVPCEPGKDTAEYHSTAKAVVAAGIEPQQGVKSEVKAPANMRTGGARESGGSAALKWRPGRGEESELQDNTTSSSHAFVALANPASYAYASDCVGVHFTFGLVAATLHSPNTPTVFASDARARPPRRPTHKAECMMHSLLRNPEQLVSPSHTIPTRISTERRPLLLSSSHQDA